MSLGDAARLAREGSGFVWLASSDPGPDELDELRAAFTCRRLRWRTHAGHQRPKLADHGEGAFLTLKTVRRGKAHIEIGELDIFLEARHAVAISRSNAAPLAGARERLDEHPGREARAHGRGVGAARRRDRRRRARGRPAR